MARRALGTTISATLLAAILGSFAVYATTSSNALIADASAEEERAADRLPARGMTMERVESVYGAPRVKHRAVGDPPIARWEYPGFVVYFEYSHVIHTVSKRQARAR